MADAVNEWNGLVAELLLRSLSYLSHLLHIYRHLMDISRFLSIAETRTGRNSLMRAEAGRYGEPEIIEYEGH